MPMRIISIPDTVGVLVYFGGEHSVLEMNFSFCARFRSIWDIVMMESVLVEFPG